jgi:TRAP-type uncharacterized transport system fused permease subunit
MIPHSHLFGDFFTFRRTLPMQSSNGFSYITQDPNWLKKVLIGSVVTAIPIVEAISDGYQIQTIKNIRAGNPQPLPEWNDATGYFKQGIGLRLVIYAIYIPTFITTVLAVFFTLASIFGWFVDDPDTRRQIDIGSFVGRKILILLIDAIVVVVLPLIFLIVPAFSRRLADGQSAFSLFNPFPTIKLILANFGTYVTCRVLVFVVITIAGIVAGVITPTGVGAILGWLILAVARFWGRLIWAFYLAQMNR